MSDQPAAATESHSSTVVEPSGVVSPTFDSRELSYFVKEDGHATVAIARMLVLFFFYSLVIMGCVVYVLWSQWMESPPDGDQQKHEHTAPF